MALEFKFIVRTQPFRHDLGRIFGFIHLYSSVMASLTLDFRFLSLVI